MAWVYVLRGASARRYIGSTDDLARRFTGHRRGSNHTTDRLGCKIELIASREVESTSLARALEQELKRKKNPRIAIFLLSSTPFQ
jgi:predicted GIY-YIG superfamily endonuclease